MQLLIKDAARRLRAFGKASIIQRADHLPDRFIDKANGIGEAGARCRFGIGIAAASELLPNADSLEVHSKQRRRAESNFAGMIVSPNFVENCADLNAIIPFHSFDGRREIRFRRKDVGAGLVEKLSPSSVLIRATLPGVKAELISGAKKSSTLVPGSLNGCVLGSLPLIMS